jgi:hypothetical protein
MATADFSKFVLDAQAVSHPPGPFGVDAGEHGPWEETELDVELSLRTPAVDGTVSVVVELSGYLRGFDASERVMRLARRWPGRA